MFFWVIGCLLFDDGFILETCEDNSSCDNIENSVSNEMFLDTNPFGILDSTDTSIQTPLDTSTTDTSTTDISTTDTSTTDTSVPQPVLVFNDIQPNYAMTDGGHQIVIEGEGFDQNTHVFFGTEEASVISYTSTTIIVQTPAMPSEGIVDVLLKSPTEEQTRPNFYFFTNQMGKTGAIGLFRSYTLMGTYWNPGASFDEGDIQFSFIAIDSLHWWEFFVPSLNTCNMSDYVYSGIYELLDLQEPQIHLMSSSGIQLNLNWDSTNFEYKLDGLTSLDVPANETFDVMPFTGGLQNFSVLNFARTSEATTIITPALQGAVTPLINRYQHFEWVPSGADWIGIYLAIQDGQGGYLEVMTCLVEDTGQFMIDGDLFTHWHHGRIIDVFFSRYIEQESVLPHNNSTARMAGEYVQFGAGMSQ